MSEQLKIDWYRTPIAKEKMSRLTERTSWKGYLQIGAVLGLFLTTASIACFFYLRSRWILFAGMTYIHCMLAAFFPSAVHELIHGTAVRSRPANEVFFRIFCWLNWTNPVLIRADHLNHHRVTTHNPWDWENPMPKVYRPWHWIFFWTFVPVDMCQVPGLFSSVRRFVDVSFGKLDGLRETVFKKPDPGKERECIRAARIHLAVHVLLAAVFIFSGLWPLLLLVTFPVFFAPAFGLMVGFTQHIGLIYNVADFRLCARTIRLNPLLRFLYWNMNYHIEHHMYAAVPFYNLGALRRDIEHDLPPAEPGLFATWKRIRPVVKKQRTDPSCCIVPELPNPQKKTGRGAQNSMPDDHKIRETGA